MTEQETYAAIDGVVYLAGCAVKGIVPDGQKIAALDLGQLFEEAQKHKVGAAVGMALESAGCRDGQFVKAVAMAQRRTVLMDADRAAVVQRLESEGIWYMPLKGAVLKALYPRFGMREMVDNDILIDRTRQEDVRRIMESLGFTTKSYGVLNDDTYLKPPLSNFEMHTSLFHHIDHEMLYAYYENVKDRLLREPGTQYGYRFSDEDFYLYVCAHEYKHYSMYGGTGIRSLLDTYVFLSQKTLDMDYVAREAAKIGIADFEKLNRSLAMHLFGGKTLNDDEREMLYAMAMSGVHGSLENYIEKQIREKGRSGYFLSRLTLPYGRMKEIYPVLNKAPVLYPFVWVYRLVSKFFLNNRKVVTEARAALNLRGSRGEDPGKEKDS